MRWIVRSGSAPAGHAVADKRPAVAIHAARREDADPATENSAPSIDETITWPHDATPEAIEQLKMPRIKYAAATPDGRWLLVASEGFTYVVNATTGALRGRVAVPAEDAIVSPQGTFVATFQTGAFAARNDRGTASGVSKDIRLSDPKFAKELQITRYSHRAETDADASDTGSGGGSSSGGDGPKENLCIWNLDTGECVAAFHQRERDTWAPHWSSDDTVCVRFTTNTVHVYKGKSFTKEGYSTIRIENIAALALEPKTLDLATFVSETKSSPASARLINLNAPNVTVSQKTFYRAKNAQIKWNAAGTTAVAVAGFSGEYAVYILTRKAALRITLDDMYIHEVVWSPTSSVFVVVHGPPLQMRATLFNVEGQRVFDFGGDMSNRGLARFSIDGSRLLLTAVQRPTSTIEIWNLSVKGTDCKRLASFSTTSITVAEFASAAGTLVLTATTLPIPQGHHYQLWNDKGRSILSHDWNNLAAVSIVPTVPISPARSATATTTPPLTQNATETDIPLSVDEIEKKIRTVTKKLRQIEPLKEKQRQGQPLEDTQVAKIATESALQGELAQLEQALSALKTAS